MKNWRSVLLIVTTCIGLILPVHVAEADFTVPSGYSDQLAMTGVSSPTAIAWLPDERLLATSKGGQVFLRTGGTTGKSILDISGRVCSSGEMGLLGLAVDPQFGTGRPFVYLYYTHKRGSSCNDASGRANRVSRFSMSGDTLIPSSERVLLDNIAAKGGNHNGGDIQFGSDGMLYVAVGDSGSDLINGDGQNGNGNARRMDILNGKILRITPEGAVPGDNPFTGSGSTACALNGQVARSTEVGVDKKNRKAKKRKKRKKRERRRERKRKRQVSATRCGEIFATGLRNPYRIAFDPDASGTPRFFINDVGGGAWEEIDEGAAGADYGWNLREGPCKVGETSDCSPDSRFVEPIFAYKHSTGCNVITGGAFVPESSAWPDSSRYLYADFGCQELASINAENPTTRTVLGTGTRATHLAFGPDGQLYYTDFSENEIHKIVFTP
jgi:glucose/arabinose dehydrogenase